jgi:hypothetical protein
MCVLEAQFAGEPGYTGQLLTISHRTPYEVVPRLACPLPSSVRPGARLGMEKCEETDRPDGWRADRVDGPRATICWRPYDPTGVGPSPPRARVRPWPGPGWSEWRRFDAVTQWQRRLVSLWMMARFVSNFSILWIARRLGGRRESRAIEEYGCAIAPLIVFALLWLLTDSVQRPQA